MSEEDGQLHRGTSNRIDGLSTEERAALHREFAGKRTPDSGSGSARRRLTPAGFPMDPLAKPSREEEELAAEAARVAADLHRTQRQLDRIERSSTRSRYVMSTGGAPHGRYARLLSRADRLERRLRKLR
jgi:hypothetical protein